MDLDHYASSTLYVIRCIVHPVLVLCSFYAILYPHFIIKKIFTCKKFFLLIIIRMRIDDVLSAGLDWTGQRSEGYYSHVLLCALVRYYSHLLVRITQCNTKNN